MNQLGSQISGSPKGLIWSYDIATEKHDEIINVPLNLDTETLTTFQYENKLFIDEWNKFGRLIPDSNLDG